MKKFLHGFRYAFKGIFFAFKTQLNFRVHLVITLLVIPLGLWLNLHYLEWAFIISAIGIVLMAELFNSAIEKLTDLVSPDFHPLAGRVKDLAAAAVLISALMALVLAILILFPKIWAIMIHYHAS